MKRNAWIGGLAIALSLNTALMVGAVPAGPGDGTTKPAPPPRPGGPGKGLLEKLEAKLGRALSETEKKEIGDALKTAEQKLHEAQDEFVGAVADATGLTLDQVKAALKGAARGPAQGKALENALGRKLTATERAAVRAAIKARCEAKKAAMDELIATIASITGLTEDEVKEALKPDCKKPGGG